MSHIFIKSILVNHNLKSNHIRLFEIFKKRQQYSYPELKNEMSYILKCLNLNKNNYFHVKQSII